MSNPKFSILCTCYNHERYIAESIDSVLTQTKKDFELIIIDDNSSDNSVVEIQKFKDPRIKLIQHEFNMGINASLNDGFLLSRGDFIVFTASDDLLSPDHLAETCKIFKENPSCNVVYCNPHFINENGKEIKDLFFIKKQTRYELLRKSFLFKNQLSSPGMAARREILDRIYPLPLSFVQFQDYAMHIELLLQGEVFISSEKFVKYRQHRDKSNLSANLNSTAMRESLETCQLMDIYTKISDVNLIKKTFKKELDEIKLEVFSDTIEYCLARISMLSSKFERQAWGYRKIMCMLNNKSYYELLHKRYNFDFKTYLSFSKKIINEDYIKYKKYKLLFNNLMIILCILFVYIVSNILFT